MEVPACDDLVRSYSHRLRRAGGTRCQRISMSCSGAGPVQKNCGATRPRSFSQFCRFATYRPRPELRRRGFDEPLFSSESASAVTLFALLVSARFALLTRPPFVFALALTAAFAVAVVSEATRSNATRGAGAGGRLATRVRIGAHASIRVAIAVATIRVCAKISARAAACIALPGCTSRAYVGRHIGVLVHCSASPTDER